MAVDFGDSRRPRTNAPAQFGSVLLEVAEYKQESGEIVAVRGRNLETSQTMEIALASPARAANMFRVAGQEDPAARREHFETEFANRTPLSAFADPSSDRYVQPGGTLVMSNVRRDFSNNNYYANKAYYFSRDPSAEMVLSGVVDLQQFARKDRDGQEFTSERLQLFQTHHAFAITPDAGDKIEQAFNTRIFPDPDAEVQRVLAVTLDTKSGDEIIPRTFYVKTEALDPDGDESKRFSLTQSIHDLVEKTKLGKWSAIAVCAMAAAVGVRNTTLEISLSALDERTHKIATEVRDSVARGETSATVTPGYDVPVGRVSRERVVREEFVTRRSFEGHINMSLKIGADGKKSASRPFAKELRAASQNMFGPVHSSKAPKTVPFEEYAKGAHERVQGILKEAKTEAESNKRPTQSRSFGDAAAPGF